MKVSKAIEQRFEYYLNEKNMTRHKLIELTGISGSVMTALLQGKYIGMNNNLFRIIKALGISISEFFNDECFNFDTLVVDN